METKKRNNLWLYIILGLVVLLFIAAVVVAFVLLRTPLGEGLALRLQPSQTPASLPTSTRAVSPTSTKAVLPTSTSAPTATPAGVCGRTDSMILLFAGTGTAGGMTSADAVRILKIDFAKPAVVVIAFPRDLWVQTPGLQDLNVKESLLGPAFDTKLKSVSGTDKAKSEAAINLLAQTLYDNFGVVSDHYITVNVEPWGTMIDTIGGVEIVLPSEVKLNNGITLPAGKQVLNGALSKEYVRSLYSASDMVRLERQDLFVKALHDKVLTADTLTKIPQLLKDFEAAIVTDLSPSDLLALSCLAEMAPPSQITFHEISGELVTSRADGALLPKTLEIKSVLVEALE